MKAVKLPSLSRYDKQACEQERSVPQWAESAPPHLEWGMLASPLYGAALKSDMAWRAQNSVFESNARAPSRASVDR